MDPITVIIGAQIVAGAAAIISDIKEGKNPFWERPRRRTPDDYGTQRTPEKKTRFQQIINE